MLCYFFKKKMAASTRKEKRFADAGEAKLEMEPNEVRCARSALEGAL